MDEPPSPTTVAAHGLRLFLLACCAGMLAACTGAPKVPGIDAGLLEKIEAKHGAEARKRVEDWRWMIEAAKDQPESAKLAGVNDFFNRLEFVDDSIHWGVNDYWATPIETLASNGGDCEDFTIAKYFTLNELGVPDERLRLTYVQSRLLHKAHMVLNYQEHADAEPLVLDNLAKAILPASLRTDLAPVYSFNGSGLWLAKQRNEGERVGDSQRVSLWKELLRRMDGEQIR